MGNFREMRKGFIVFIIAWIIVWTMSYPNGCIGNLGEYLVGNYCLFLFLLFSVLFAGIVFNEVLPRKDES